MTRRSALTRRAGLVGVAALIAVGGGLGLRALGTADAGDKDHEAVSASVQTRRVGGTTQIVAPPAAQRAGAIVTHVLGAASVRREVQALASVVVLQPLIDQRRSVIAATLDVRRAVLAASAATLEARRLGLLNADGKLVSDKALEVARTAAATEAANVATARSQVALATATLASQWGPVIAGWIVRGDGRLERLVSGRDVLLQVAPVTGEVGPRPAYAALQLPGGTLRATVVSAAAQVDPKFQTPGFYAVAPANTALVPGAAVAALLPGGGSMQGVAVPEEAVIRADGKPYVYVVVGSGQFARRAITTDTPIAGGWLVGSGLAPGERVVVRGAQLLLSQEGKAAGPSGAER